VITLWCKPLSFLGNFVDYVDPVDFHQGLQDKLESEVNACFSIVKWLENLAMFFVVVCFCLLFGGLTLHKTYYKKVVMSAHTTNQ